MDYLKENNIPFNTKDVTQDPEAAREVIEKTNQRGIPVTEIDGQYIIGYDLEQINRALGIV